MKLKNKIIKTLAFSLAGAMILATNLTTMASAEPVKVIPTRIQADYIQYNTKTGMTELNGNVVITRESGIIKAGKGQYNTKTKAGNLSGGVNGTQEDAKIVCDEIIMHEGGVHITAKGDAYIKKEDTALKAEQVEYYEDRNYMETKGSWAELSMDDGSYLKANFISYDIENGKAIADGNVRIKSDVRNLSATAQKATYDIAEDGVITLTGNAKATQNGNTIQSEVIKITNTAAANKQIASASGNVKLVYVPK